MRLVDPTKLARHAAAIRAASLITNEPASTLGLRTCGGSTYRRHPERSHVSGRRAQTAAWRRSLRVGAARSARPRPRTDRPDA